MYKLFYHMSEITIHFHIIEDSPTEPYISKIFTYLKDFDDLKNIVIENMHTQDKMIYAHMLETITLLNTGKRTSQRKSIHDPIHFKFLNCTTTKEKIPQINNPLITFEFI